MIRADAQAKIGLGLLGGNGTRNHVAVVGLARQALAHGNQAAQHVSLVVGLDALHDGSRALEAEAGVDVLGGQRRERAVFLAVELGEHAVPILEETVAITTRSTVRLAAAELGTLVVVKLGARTARAGRAGAPEVVVLAQTRDVVFGDAERLPDLDGLVVVLEDSEVQLLDREPQHVGRELERPSAHLFFEILAEAEVAHHLEERQMTTGCTDDVNVVGAHALLNGGRANVVGIEFLDMQKVRLELNHTCTREQQRRVVGNQR